MQRTRYADKLLPNQEYFKSLYRGTASFESAVYDIVASYAADFEAKGFELDLPTDVDFEEMSTPPGQLALFNALVHLIGAETILEIGTFVGHSTMQFAGMLGNSGHVTTIELFPEFANLARQNFDRNGFSERITLLEGEAGENLKALPERSFDLIFVDGGKEHYLPYTKRAMDLLSDNGIIIIDDIFFHGDALNDEPTTEKGQGCRDVLDYFKDKKSINRLLLPLGNGLLLLFNNRRESAA